VKREPFADRDARLVNVAADPHPAIVAIVATVVAVSVATERDRRRRQAARRSFDLGRRFL
jgi:uncharacterized sporulation protein YeaH/YhbH (DUF444 family)